MSAYIEDIGYDGVLRACIMDINNAINHGLDGVIPLETFFYTMFKDIREPMREELKALQLQTDRDLKEFWNDINNHPEKYITAQEISKAHIQQAYDQEVLKINRGTVQESKALLIDHLHKNNLLLKKEREIPKGYSKRIPEETIP